MGHYFDTRPDIGFIPITIPEAVLEENQETTSEEETKILADTQETSLGAPLLDLDISLDKKEYRAYL